MVSAILSYKEGQANSLPFFLLFSYFPYKQGPYTYDFKDSGFL